MKQKLLKSLKVIAVLMIALFAVLAISDAAGYNKSSTRIQVPAGWAFLRYSHTFVATTDTAYFPFQAGQAKNLADDTLAAVAHVIVVPASDTSNVAWEVWASGDTTGWKQGATQTTALKTGLWTITAIARDSVASGYTNRVINIGRIQNGNLPYVMLVGIGKAAVSGGKANEIGNAIKANIIVR